VDQDKGCAVSDKLTAFWVGIVANLLLGLTAVSALNAAVSFVLASQKAHVVLPFCIIQCVIQNEQKTWLQGRKLSIR
jgi:hypothetical protein